MSWLLVNTVISITVYPLKPPLFLTHTVSPPLDTSFQSQPFRETDSLPQVCSKLAPPLPPPAAKASARKNLLEPGSSTHDLDHSPGPLCAFTLSPVRRHMVSVPQGHSKMTSSSSTIPGVPPDPEPTHHVSINSKSELSVLLRCGILVASTASYLTYYSTSLNPQSSQIHHS